MYDIKLHGRFCDHLDYRGTSTKFDLTQIASYEGCTLPTGSFAIVQFDSNDLLLGCDAIASIPLFWSVDQNNECIHVSDSATEIASAGYDDVDSRAFQELSCAGYVQGNRTLYQSVNAVGPGEIIRLSLDDASISVDRWFNLDYIFPSIGDASIDDYVDLLELTFETVFSNLIDRLHGRQAIIPLSGGLDSRTVAVWLKKLGYENVVCVSYGRRGNFETNCSKEIASALGYDWKYVEYNGDTWRSLFTSEQYWDFLDFAGRGYTIGCVQALPAFSSLMSQESFDSDVVVIPGHALDYIAGSHLPSRDLFSQWNRETLSRHLKDTHFSLSRLNADVEIDSAANWPESNRYSDMAHCTMEWEWRNRQSKFIANDVRTYEFFKLGFELPFWDARVCSFFSALSIELLFDRVFQRYYVARKIDPICMRNAKAPVESEFFTYDVEHYLNDRAKRLGRRISFARKAVKQYRAYTGQHRDPNAFFEFLDSNEYKRMVHIYGPGFNLNSLVANDYLRLLSDGCRFDLDRWYQG